MTFLGVSGRLALSFLILLILAAVFAHALAPYPFDFQNTDRILLGASWTNWMGTDRLGRDLFSRLLMGSRMSLAVGVFTAAVSLVLGALVGGVSGWCGGWVDRLCMSIIDVVYALPTLVVMILVKLFIDGFLPLGNPEAKAFVGTLVALSVVGWMTMARMVRGQVLQKKQALFVEAGRALGQSSASLVFRTVFPNIMGPVIVLVTLRIPANILFESFLSFIGLGLKPPYSSWGTLAANGIDNLESFPHLILFPGLILFLSMMAFQILGDELRDKLDPKTEGRSYEKI